jgi:uncharacterized protein YndB with AHSA1/START domain
VTDIVVVQSVAAPPSVVYRYLTDETRWARWQGADARLDPVPGGFFSMDTGHGMHARGEFVELIPDRRVVMTWGWVDRPGIPPGSTVVEIDLEETDAGTRVVLTHRNLPEGEAELHSAGWRHYMPRLATVAEGGDPGPDPGVGG